MPNKAMQDCHPVLKTGSDRTGDGVGGNLGCYSASLPATGLRTRLHDALDCTKNANVGNLVAPKFT